MSEGGGGGGGGNGFFQELVTKLGYQVDTEGLEHLNHQLETVAERAKILLGIEIVKGLYELSERFAGLGENLEASAIAAGMTTEELQKLQFAASQNAVSNQALSGILMRLGRAMEGAKKGSKGASEAFKKLGIDNSQLAGFSSVTEALYAVQDGMQSVETQADRLSIATSLLGRNGARSLKFLKITSDETKQLGDRAKDMGAVVSDEGIKALAEFEDAASGLGQVLKGFFAQVASVFAPSFIGAIHSIEDAWARNRAIITEGLMEIGHRFAYVMGFVSAVVDNFSKVVTAILYRKGGVGEYVKNIAAQIWDIVKATAKGIGSLIESANNDGSLKELGTSLIELGKQLFGVVTDIVDGLGEALLLLLQLFGMDTSGLDKGNAALRATLATLTAIVKVLTSLTKFVRLFTGGKIGDALGQTFLGDLAGASMMATSRADYALNRRRQDPNYSPLNDPLMMHVNPVAPLADFAAANEAMRNMSMPGVSPGFTPQTFAKGRELQITSNVTVNVPAGMATGDTVRMMKQASKEALKESILETHRDTVSAWHY